MKITILAESLNRGLSIVNRSVAIRPQLPVLGNVLMKTGKEGLELVSTDLEMSFRVKLGAKVEEEGEVSLPAKLLTELMATINGGTVSISVDKEKLKLESGKTRSEMSAVSAGEFPSVPTFKGEADIVFGSDELCRVINRVAVSASKDDSRPIFTGILWAFDPSASSGQVSSKVKFVATDGYRLGIDEVEVAVNKLTEAKKLVVPARALTELVRVAEKSDEAKIEIKVDEEKQQLIFRLGEVELVSRLLAGDFPPYQQILPKDFKTKVEFDRGELLDAVKRGAIFARESANIIKLVASSEKLVVSANSSEVGRSETEIEAKTDGDDLTIAFNSRYLLEYLSNTNAELLQLKSEGSLKAGVFEEIGKSKSSFLQVIMPVRVQE